MGKTASNNPDFPITNTFKFLFQKSKTVEEIPKFQLKIKDIFDYLRHLKYVSDILIQIQNFIFKLES